MEHSPPPKGYSAEVRLELRAQGKIIDLASIGPNQFVPRSPLDIDACDAEIRMVVDGDVFVWPIRIPHGACPFDKKVVTQDRGAMERHGKT